MSGDFSRYRDALASMWPTSDWWIAWPLTGRLEIGDVLTVQGRAVRTAGKLEKQGLEIETRAAATGARYHYDAEGSVEITLKAAGMLDTAFTGLAQAEAGMRVSFGAKATALVLFNGVDHFQTVDTRTLAQELLVMALSGQWDLDQVVVTEVVKARRATVLISKEHGAEAVLRFQAGTGVLGGTLTDLSGRGSVAHRRSLGVEYVDENLTPCYQVVRVRRDFLRRVRAQYDMDQPGRGSQARGIPPVLLDQVREDPHSVLEAVRAPEDAEAP